MSLRRNPSCHHSHKSLKLGRMSPVCTLPRGRNCRLFRWSLWRSMAQVFLPHRLRMLDHLECTFTLL